MIRKQSIERERERERESRSLSKHEKGGGRERDRERERERERERIKCVVNFSALILSDASINLSFFVCLKFNAQESFH